MRKAGKRGVVEDRMWSTSPRENRSAKPAASAPGRYSGARPQDPTTNRPGSPTQRASASPAASPSWSLPGGLVGICILGLPDVGPVDGARVAGVHHGAGVAGATRGGDVGLVEGTRVGGVHHHARVAGAAERGLSPGLIGEIPGAALSASWGGALSGGPSPRTVTISSSLTWSGSDIMVAPSRAGQRKKSS